MVESRTVNAVVVGSSPTCPANMLGSVVKRSTNSTAVSFRSVYTEVQQEWVKNRHSHPNKVNAPIAHSVERLPCKQGVRGSSPLVSSNGSVERNIDGDKPGDRVETQRKS